MNEYLIKIFDFLLSYGVILSGLVSSVWVILKVPFLRKVVTLFINDFIEKYKHDVMAYTDKKVQVVTDDVEFLKDKFNDIENDVIKLKQGDNYKEKIIQGILSDIKDIQNILMKGSN